MCFKALLSECPQTQKIIERTRAMQQPFKSLAFSFVIIHCEGIYSADPQNNPLRMAVCLFTLTQMTRENN